MLRLENLLTNKSLQKNVNHLINFSFYSESESLEGIVFHSAEVFSDETEEKKFFGIFAKVVDSFQHEFYRNKQFLTDQYVYDIFYYHLRDNLINNSKHRNAEDIIRLVFDDINRYQIVTNSLVIHPLADFGFQSVGAKEYFVKNGVLLLYFGRFHYFSTG